jgi:hypothetical protein
MSLIQGGHDDDHHARANPLREVAVAAAVVLRY